MLGIRYPQRKGKGVGGNVHPPIARSLRSKLLSVVGAGRALPASHRSEATYGVGVQGACPREFALRSKAERWGEGSRRACGQMPIGEKRWGFWGLAPKGCA